MQSIPERDYGRSVSHSNVYKLEQPGQCKQQLRLQGYNALMLIKAIFRHHMLWLNEGTSSRIATCTRASKQSIGGRTKTTQMLHLVLALGAQGFGPCDSSSLRKPQRKMRARSLPRFLAA